MSLQAEQIVELDRDVRQRIKRLKCEVLDERNPIALFSLLELAVFATRSLHELWSEVDPVRWTADRVN